MVYPRGKRYVSKEGKDVVMSSTKSPPSSSESVAPSDDDVDLSSDTAPTPRPATSVPRAGEPPKGAKSEAPVLLAPDFRVQTLQSAQSAQPPPEDTQERPPFDLPAEPPPLNLTADSPVKPSDRLDAFVAVSVANADRIARSQEQFLERLAQLLEEDADEEDEEDKSPVRPLPTPQHPLARDLRVLILLVAAVLAVAVWSAGRQSTPQAPPIVVTPPAP